MGKRITKKQKEILDFIEDFVEKNGYSPTIREITAHFNLNALSGIHKHLKNLERTGYIKRDPGKARGIEIVKKEKTHFPSLPVMGYITAGEPLEKVEMLEYMQVPPEFISTGEYFLLKVKGDSMIDAHIVENDIIVVKKQEYAENGDMVVALIDNSETTLKRFYKRDGKIVLKPENISMKPITISPERIKIQGVVVGVLRKY